MKRPPALCQQRTSTREVCGELRHEKFENLSKITGATRLRYFFTIQRLYRSFSQFRQVQSATPHRSCHEQDKNAEKFGHFLSLGIGVSDSEASTVIIFIAITTRSNKQSSPEQVSADRRFNHSSFLGANRHTTDWSESNHWDELAAEQFNLRPRRRSQVHAPSENLDCKTFAL